MVEAAGKPATVAVGTMIRVKDAWRVIDSPLISEDMAAESETKPFFFATSRSERPAQDAVGKPSKEVEDLMGELNKLGDISAQSTRQQHERRIEILEQLASKAEGEMRANWYRQLADTLNAAAQTANYPGAIDRLKTNFETLKADAKDDELASYFEFRILIAEHASALAGPNPPFPQIQKKWIEDLEKYLQASKKYPDSADAMMELAIAEEFGGDEDKVLKWYESIVKDFPSSPIHRKAEGGRLRLISVGKPIPLRGKLLNGQKFDLAALKGKVVLIQYWATWCEPCKSDMPLLKDLRGKYKGNFEVVGVCLDSDKKEMTSFLQENDPHWPQLFEEGGLENRYALEMGIQTLPTMILIDKAGVVVNRNIRAGELDGELKKLLK